MGLSRQAQRLKLYAYISISIQCMFILNKLSNSNWTDWSTIQGVIGRVISKWGEREARGRFEITSTITP